MGRYFLTDVAGMHYITTMEDTWRPSEFFGYDDEELASFDTREEAEKERERLLARDCHVRVVFIGEE